MQINRLFEMVYMLLDWQILTAKELAEHFEVSTRTIYRDVEILSGAGIPIYMSKGKGGGIRLLPDYVLNKAVITEQEQGEILSSLHAMGAVGLEESNTALAKLGSLFGDTNTDWLEVDFGFWSDGEKEAELFQELKHAILGRNVVKFQYVSSKGEKIEREVEPIKMVFKSMAWYLYGFCRLRQGCRFFKLKRIKDIQVMQETFTPQIRKKVLEKQQYQPNATRLNVKLLFKKEAAFLVYDGFDEYTQLEDGSIMVEGVYEDREWLLHHLLSYGSNCQVLEPQALKLQVQQEIERMMDNYKKT